MYICVIQTETKKRKGQMFVPVLVSFFVIQSHCVSQDLQLCPLIILVEGLTAHVTASSSHHPLWPVLTDILCISLSGCKPACMLFKETALIDSFLEGSVYQWNTVTPLPLQPLLSCIVW